MWRNCERILWFVLGSAALACSQTPKPDFADPSALPFFVRMQRTRSGRDVCAIVRGDGLFHMEQETSSHSEIAEGALDEEELAALRSVLNSQDLAAISQQKIPIPLMITERDVFRISILRPPLIQTLTFLDRESRRSFDRSIDPLLHWMDLLQKHSHTKLDEYSGRNNCFPPHKIELSLRQAQKPKENIASSSPSTPGGPAPVQAPALSSPDPFLMHWQFDHIAEGVVNNVCVVVYPSGRFRMEKSNQSYGDKLKMRAFEDSLNQGDLQQLKELLDDPALKSSTHQNFLAGKSFRDGELTVVYILRDGHLQQLSFASYFARWMSSVNASTDPEEHLVKPLRKWLKSHIETRKLEALPDAPATHCVARPLEKTP